MDSNTYFRILLTISSLSTTDSAVNNVLIVLVTMATAAGVIMQL